MTGAGKRHAIAQAGPEVFFPPLSSQALNTLSLLPAKIFVTRNKKKKRIKVSHYNLCFVDPSFGFVSIITITPFYHISTCIISTNMLALI